MSKLKEHSGGSILIGGPFCNCEWSYELSVIPSLKRNLQGIRPSLKKPNFWARWAVPTLFNDPDKLPTLPLNSCCHRPLKTSICCSCDMGGMWVQWMWYALWLPWSRAPTGLEEPLNYDLEFSNGRGSSSVIIVFLLVSDTISPSTS